MLILKQNAVDVEVSILDASMNIGVFGPGDLIEVDKADTVISRVVDVLRELL
jgi:hypothetical protein